MTRTEFIRATESWPEDAEIYINRGFGNAIESRNVWLDNDRNAIVIG